MPADNRFVAVFKLLTVEHERHGVFIELIVAFGTGALDLKIAQIIIGDFSRDLLESVLNQIGSGIVPDVA